MKYQISLNQYLEQILIRKQNTNRLTDLVILLDENPIILGSFRSNNSYIDQQ